jgi:hypothetical protein
VLIAELVTLGDDVGHVPSFYSPHLFPLPQGDLAKKKIYPTIW